jgi:LPPG:FO 2-phospho-L-lactate transferase
MEVAALAGGVGGAKLLVGLQEVLPPGHLTAIVNTGDDDSIYGVHVSPDVDIVTYWLAGIADRERGWGISGDTFTLIDALAELGHETWFRLGDRDYVTCLARTLRESEGISASLAASEIALVLGVDSRVLPMTDDRVRTRVITTGGADLSFQEYFVREKTEPEVSDVLLQGIEEAKPAPGVLDAIASSERVILCPSNPHLSIGPILALAGVTDALRAHPLVIAVTPIVGGKALKGPADRLLAALGQDVSATGVAHLYADFCDVFVVDSSDEAEIDRVSELGVRAVALDTIMSDLDASARLAAGLLNL